MCDSQTINAKYIVIGDHVRRDYIGEGIWIIESEGKKWHYLPDQTPEEVTLLKISDSRENAEAKCACTKDPKDLEILVCRKIVSMVPSNLVRTLLT